MTVNHKKTSDNWFKVSLAKLLNSVWLFPVIILILLLCLTALRISGSSVGAYHPVIYGAAKDPDLVANEPRLIRSDEWHVATQMTIAQSAAGFPKVNDNLYGGTDMSIIGDSPYKDWSSVFKPQNLAFFVLPLEHAFAFKWWLLLALTMIGCYFLVLRLLPGKRLLASLIASSAALSPFLLWWYGTGTFAPMFYGFFIIILGIRIINGEPIPLIRNRPLVYSQAIYALCLGYLLAAFALILYPPFQIPIALGVTAFLAGYLLEQSQGLKKIFTRKYLLRIGLFALSAFLALLVVFAFIQTRKEAVSAVQNTVYPGARQIDGGGTQLVRVFSSFLQPQLERQTRAVYYYDNQSESSNFLFLLPFLLVPGFALIIMQYRQTHKLNWVLLLLQLCGLLFMAHLFIRGPDFIYQLFLLDQVPHVRLFMGLGFVGILQFIYLIKTMGSIKISRKAIYLLSVPSAIGCLAISLWVGLYVRLHYPQFIHSLPLIILFALVFAVIVLCILQRRFILGASTLLIFSLISVFHIHPLYQGLGFLETNDIFKTIQKVSKPGDVWATLDNGYYENFAIMSNRGSISGVQTYPHLSLWRQVNGPKDDYIYNRYANVLFSTDDNMSKPLSLIAPDSFQVKFSCTTFIKKHVDYALATQLIDDACVKLVGKVHYPATDLYFYKVQ